MRGIKNTKQRAVRKTRTEQYLINLKYMGEEPMYDVPLTEGDYMSSLNWYNYMCDLDDAREYTETYYKENKPEWVSGLKKIPDSYFPRTAAWICRMLNNGFELPETAVPFMTSKIESMITRFAAARPDKDNVISAQDRIRERSYDIIGDIEKSLDDDDEFSLYEWLIDNRIPAAYGPRIIDYYRPWIEELCAATKRKVSGESSDKQLVEAYSKYTTKQLIDRINTLNRLINDVERYIGVKKETRKPRKTKPFTKERLLKFFTYLTMDVEHNLKSINPERIIGAQELWAFNTKYKILTVFRAKDVHGLKVHRSSIIDYNEETSISKSTGRVTESTLKEVLSGGKVALRKVMDGLKTDKILQHRINENTILLRVL